MVTVSRTVNAKEMGVSWGTTAQWRATSRRDNRSSRFPATHTVPAAGLMIPFTSDSDIARRIVESVKFPPVGNRGIDGAGLDADFGLGHFFTENSTWIEDANQETFIVGQIETPGAVAKVDEIEAVPGLE